MNPIIVPVVVGPQISQRCIDSALAQDVEDVQVIVFGNGSTDGSIPFLRAKYARNTHVTIFAHPIMESLNKVWNAAIDYALKLSEHCLVLNNDVEIRPDMYRLLRDDGGLFVTGVSVGSREDTKNCDFTSKSPHPCFSAFFIRKECWEKTGKFDENMWAYASDGDYHLRMDEKEIDAYAIAVPFYHETSSTLKLATPQLRDKIIQKADADRTYFLKKWGFKVGSPEYYAAFRNARDNKYEKEGVL